MFKKKNARVPRNSKLFTILRGIDEQEIAEARKMQGFEQSRKVESGVTKIELVKINDKK